MNGTTVVFAIGPEANLFYYLDDVENVVTTTLDVVLQFIRDTLVVVRLDNVSSERPKAISTVLLLKINNFV